MQKKTIRQLRQALLFRELPDEMLRNIAEKVRPLSLKKDGILFRKEDPGDSLFIIGKGRVKIVTQDASGLELTINQCGAGETVGDMSLFDQARRSAGVIALEKVDALELKRSDFLNLIDQRPDIALSVIRGMSARTRWNTEFIQKVTEWSKKIAEGDFSFAEQEQSDNLLSGISSKDRASQFLTAFFSMARNVKALQQEVVQLRIEINETKRRKEVVQITTSDYYISLKEKLKALREEEDEVSAPPGAAMRLIYEKIEASDEKKENK